MIGGEVNDRLFSSNRCDQSEPIGVLERLQRELAELKLYVSELEDRIKTLELKKRIEG